MPSEVVGSVQASFSAHKVGSGPLSSRGVLKGVINTNNDVKIYLQGDVLEKILFADLVAMGITVTDYKPCNISYEHDGVKYEIRC